MNTKKSGKLFILSAPSGGGKTTLANKLVEELGFEYNLSRVITYTSRLPRSTEMPGVDYNFLSKEAFEEKVKEQFFLEWSGVYGNYCGTPSTIIEEVNYHIIQESDNCFTETNLGDLSMFIRVDADSLLYLRKLSGEEGLVFDFKLTLNEEFNLNAMTGMFYPIQGSVCSVEENLKIGLKVFDDLAIVVE
jgi:hypothetical protein